MADYRLTILFQFAGPPAAGFSERYDLTAGSWDDARNQAQIVINGRRRFLSSDWRIFGVRLGTLSSVLVSGKCKLRTKDVYLCPSLNIGPGLLGPADSPNASVFADFSYGLGSGKPSRRQLRGIPDDWWTATALSPVVNTFLQSFRASLDKANHVRLTMAGGGCTITEWHIDCINTRRISSRRTGRPFGQLRGRRHKKHV